MSEPAVHIRHVETNKHKGVHTAYQYHHHHGSTYHTYLYQWWWWWCCGYKAGVTYREPSGASPNHGRCSLFHHVRSSVCIVLSTSL